MSKKSEADAAALVQTCHVLSAQQVGSFEPNTILIQYIPEFIAGMCKWNTHVSCFKAFFPPFISQIVKILTLYTPQSDAEERVTLNFIRIVQVNIFVQSVILSRRWILKWNNNEYWMKIKFVKPHCNCTSFIYFELLLYISNISQDPIHQYFLKFLSAILISWSNIIHFCSSNLALKKSVCTQSWSWNTK